jgi:HEAT repeat protein
VSYELEAYLAPLAALEGDQQHPVPETVYRLTDELGLVPLCGTVDLDKSWPIRASRGTTVARVSADYFGGTGSQSATVWSDGEVVADNVDVNAALRHLGVEKSGGQDEWDSVGLGKFRRTETWAAEAIRAGRKSSDTPLETLLEALRYTSPNQKQQEKVRAAAATNLGELGDEAAIPHLVAAVKASGEEGLRIAAAAALAEIGGPALAELAAMLHEKESRRPSKRDSSGFFPVIHALGEAGPAAGPFTDDLVFMLRHANASTRSDAAQALGKIGPPAANAVPALIETLRDEEPSIRSYAAKALGQIGPAAQAAAPVLSTCLEDEAHYVRDSAEAALAAIDQSPERQ